MSKMLGRSTSTHGNNCDCDVPIVAGDFCTTKAGRKRERNGVRSEIDVGLDEYYREQWEVNYEDHRPGKHPVEE